jgi:hypothetical protein
MNSEEEELDKIFNEWIYLKRMLFDPKRGLHIHTRRRRILGTTEMLENTLNNKKGVHKIRPGWFINPKDEN